MTIPQSIGSSELLRILDGLERLPAIDAQEWNEGIAATRNALEKLNLHFDDVSGKQAVFMLCRKITVEILASHHELGLDIALLKDPTIQTIRQEMNLRISLRLSVASHHELPALLAMTRANAGELDITVVREHPSTKLLGATLKSHAENFVMPFKDESDAVRDARKQLAYGFIAQFLSEQLGGMHVAFVGLKFRGKRGREKEKKSEPAEPVPTKKIEPAAIWQDEEKEADADKDTDAESGSRGRGKPNCTFTEPKVRPVHPPPPALSMKKTPLRDVDPESGNPNREKQITDTENLIRHEIVVAVVTAENKEAFDEIWAGMQNPDAISSEQWKVAVGKPLMLRTESATAGEKTLVYVRAIHHNRGRLIQVNEKNIAALNLFEPAVAG